MPPKSHSRLPSFRYTRLGTLLALFGFTRQKQHPVVFDFATHSLLRRSLAIQNLPPSREQQKGHLRMSFLLFWVRRRDLNLATSGLWARRATKLLYSAIYRFPNGNRGADDRTWTGTGISSQRILSPWRLPIPPHRHVCLVSISHIFFYVNPFFKKN